MIDSIAFRNYVSGAGEDVTPDDNTGGSSGGSSGGSTSHTYTAFTSSDKSLIRSVIGEVFPFVPNDDYHLSQETDEYGDYVNFYAYGVSASEYDAYLSTFSAYELDGTEVDEYGDTWYYFVKGDVCVSVGYYEYNGAYIVDVYAYLLDDSGSSGGSSGSGDSSSTTPEGIELLTNDGKGLPSGSNGIYTVDFTKATYVKNVHDQGYYLDGCPTTGNVKVLVIPVEFSDVTASSKGYTTQKINTAFNGASGTTDYLSVSEYYKTSSNGKLNLTFDVMSSWFRPSNNSSYYLNATMDYGGQQVECGDQIIINEFLKKYDSTMDFSQYDSDGNGTIDAVVLINTLEINYDVTMKWAYRYWNLYTDSNDNYYEYDGVSANDYLWASYQFLFEGANGQFNDKNAMNTYTYIHEFGHVLGADDYYDTAYVGSPMGGHDMMDSETGDHNPYTKFNYGWITSSRLVTASNTVTLTLNDFATTGDTIIIANNWDDKLGAYQEYFVLIYYKNGSGVNTDGFGYFDEDGVVVYHVNASLYKEVYDGETYYDVYNSNTDISDENGYGTENNLIELINNGATCVFGAGDSLAKNTYTDGGEKIAYTFSVTSLSNGSATIQFTKNN